MKLGRRIMILGSSGSGKSTLAKILGELTHLPVTHLDSLYWKPGWVESGKEEMNRKVIEGANADKWIIDGNYSHTTMEYRIKRADSIIFIDFNRYFCIFRVIKRRIKYHGKIRPDMGEGCIEKIDMEFLKWVWNYPKNSKKNTLDLIYKFLDSKKNIYILKTRRQVKNFIKSIKTSN